MGSERLRSCKEDCEGCWVTFESDKIKDIPQQFVEEFKKHDEENIPNEEIGRFVSEADDSLHFMELIYIHREVVLSWSESNKI